MAPKEEVGKAPIVTDGNTLFRLVRYARKVLSVIVFIFLLSGGGLAYGASSGSYQDWISSSHSISFSNHGCGELSSILYGVRKAGGGVIPIGQNRFFIMWLPEGWDLMDRKRIVTSLHGNGGCAERMFNFWYRNRSLHKFGIIALQYAETDSSGNLHFDDSRTIYSNLLEIINQLREHLHMEDVPLVLHGFSRGSARVFEIAALDRAPDGMRAFSAFIADSGTVFPENQGRLSQLLREFGETACYKGANFWVYCGGRDHRGRTCRGLARMCAFVREHGGKINTFYQYPPGGHGIFITGGPNRPSPALDSLFSNIDNLN